MVLDPLWAFIAHFQCQEPLLSLIIKGRFLMKKVVIICLVLPFMVACSLDSLAKSHRSEAQKNAFKHANPCPSNGNNHGPCPGYVIDHIVPLACGGPDDASNMQWQTIEDGKIKDSFELSMCGK